MSNSNIAFLEVPLSMFILKNALDTKYRDLGILKHEVSFVIPESKQLERLKLKYFSTSYSKFYKARNFIWLLNNILESYHKKIENVFICDIGIFNKLLIILIRSKNVFILDDGLASAMRKKTSSRIIIFLSKVFRKKEVFYMSMFGKSFSFQDGVFNINFVNTAEIKCYKDKCFYICSGPTLDGMNIEDENHLIKKIISFSNQNGQDLIILPHRRDISKLKKDYIYGSYIHNNYETFEEFYTENKFYNCSFMTLYSSAIFSVDDKNEKYILRDFFIPKVPSYNFFLRLLGKKINMNVIYKFMEDNLQNIIVLKPKDLLK